jgi:hypothetical protein
MSAKNTCSWSTSPQTGNFKYMFVLFFLILLTFVVTQIVTLSSVITIFTLVAVAHLPSINCLWRSA